MNRVHGRCVSVKVVNVNINVDVLVNTNVDVFVNTNIHVFVNVNVTVNVNVVLGAHTVIFGGKYRGILDKYSGI